MSRIVPQTCPRTARDISQRPPNQPVTSLARRNYHSFTLAASRILDDTPAAAPQATPHTSPSMSSDEKMRSSVDNARDPAQPVLPTVNPEAQKSAPEPASFHPAVYIA